MKNKAFFLFAGIFFFNFHGSAQKAIIIPKNEYGLEIVDNETLYKKIIFIDSNQKMVSVREYIPKIVLHLQYATKNNFAQRAMYPQDLNYTFLKLPVVRALAKVENELNAKGLGLKIFDAYRPYSITKKFWEIIHDERYVANPSKASGHNRGVAVDLTIVHLQNGEELNMGTGFDNFSDSAHQNFSMPADIAANRKLLLNIMEKYGFENLDTEWWHYSFYNAEKYYALDLPFKILMRNN
jgi:D-alanyl-D-alanine dipeptidase